MSQTDLYDEDDDTEDGDDGQQDDNSVIRKLRGSLKEANKRAKITDEERAELAQHRASAALSGAGLELNPRQQSALLKELGDEPLTADNLRTVAVELGFAEPVVDQEADAEAAAQAAIAAASKGANLSGSSVTGIITAEEYGSWDVARRSDFRNRHPEAIKAFQRGESVRV